MIINYFIKTSNQEENINAYYNVSQNEVQAMLEIIKDWIQLQPHLPKETGDVFETRLKCLLRCNKMSVEKTKSKLDMYYSLKNFFPEFFENKEPLNPKIALAMKTAIVIPLRKPMDDLTRVGVLKLADLDPKLWDVNEILKLGLNTLEIQTRFDYCPSSIQIHDLQGWTFSHNLSSNPFTVTKMVKIFERAFAKRVIGIHFINAPAYAVTLINTMKSILKNKIIERIFFHENIEDLHKYIPKEILPLDYGGEDISLLEMRDQYTKFLQDNNDWFVELGKLKSNEKLRIGKYVDNDLFGTEGTFRKLDID